MAGIFQKFIRRLCNLRALSRCSRTTLSAVNWRLMLIASAVVLLGWVEVRAETVRMVYPNKDGLYQVEAVARLSRVPKGNKEGKHQPCEARLGDVIEVYVRNLGLWLRDIEKQRRIDASNGNTDPEQVLPFKEQQLEALVIKNEKRLCLLIDNRPFSTVRVVGNFSKPSWVNTYPLSSNGKLLLREMTKKEQQQWDELCKAGKADPENNELLRKQIADGKITRTIYHTLHFRLIRDSGDAQSRAEWARLLQVSEESKMKCLSIGLISDDGNVYSMPTQVKPPRTEETVQKAEEQFSFDRLPLTDPWVIAGGVALLLAATGCLWLARGTSLLRIGSGLPGSRPYSLDRCQMAFWFFLTAWAFLFLWLVTGRGDTDTLTPQALAMMSISAATGLGAAFIGSGGDASGMRESKGLLLDLVTESDAQGVSFHRFQMIVWTLVLGIIFVSEVLTRLMMPKFDGTLLALMGISSGTYLGFKSNHGKAPTAPAPSEVRAPSMANPG